jgi:PAS domain S-box-containing protein
MIENLSNEQIAGILESLPLDITFADDNDTVKYWNKPDAWIFQRPTGAVGDSVQKCHSADSVDKVNTLIADLKSGRTNFVEYRIELNGRKIKVTNLAVRDKNGKYLGVMEIDQDITDIKKSVGEKRLPR